VRTQRLGVPKTLGLVIAVFLPLCSHLQGQDAPKIQLAEADQTAWDILPQMLNITYAGGPEVPSCGRSLQTSNGGIIHDTLISVAGFGIPTTCPESEKKFIKKVYGLKLRGSSSGWKELPDLPGSRRQAHAAIPVGNRLYLWGGFSYFDPYTYRDGYRLSKERGEWIWESMPDLPWATGGAGICAIDEKIYIFGGMDYNREKMYTNADRNGKIPRLGARLLVFDTRNPNAGWKNLTICPGTARWYPAVSAAGGKVYVLGGLSGGDNAAGQYCTVVDNWSYDPARSQWERLPDLPIASGNYPSGQITYDDRFILLVGGYQYASILNPDGSVRPSYGRPYKHYKKKGYYADVMVYDTKTRLFGRGDPLPLNNNMPSTVVEGNRFHMFGSETEEAIVEGKHYEHRPNLYLIGTIAPIDEQDWRDQIRFLK